MIKIADKHQSIDMFARGCFGNNVNTYRCPSVALTADCKDSNYVIRYKGKPGVQGPAVFGIRWYDLLPTWRRLVLEEKWEEDRLYVNDEVPRDRIVFQGEVDTGNWADRGWTLRGHLGGGCHMREAMTKSSTWRGWPARELLRKHMDPSSWEDLQCIIDMHPTATIELVIFDTPYGSLAYTGRNTIVWEVRDY